MPNGRNSGRLFSDCFNEYGYGESHPTKEDHKPGDVFECPKCEAMLKVVEDGHVERLTSSLANADHYVAADTSPLR